MKQRYSTGSKIMTCFFIALGVVWLYPVFLVLITAFRPNGDINMNTFGLPPKESFTLWPVCFSNTGARSFAGAVKFAATAIWISSATAEREKALQSAAETATKQIFLSLVMRHH